ncbi:ATP-binding protein [Thermodesulfitimonas autotrophica]|uniref:ATP-binding protein n=1 Tax=Thermodesulfitimonas autotrophica TaxID=1894989 RepID=UPI000F4FD9BF|nr:ATP-binding protein [Thermodesulfitimonas autotrophica]
MFTSARQPPDRGSTTFCRFTKKKGGRLLGWLIFHVSIDEILQFAASQQEKLGRTGEIILARRDGTVINTLRRQAHAALAFKPGTPDIEAAIHGREGVIETRDYTGSNVIAAVRYLPETSWGLVVKQEAAEFLAPVRNHALTQGGISLITLAALLILLAFTIRRLTGPLSRLTATATQLAAGDLSPRVPEISGEIGLLARSFNEMAGALEEHFTNQVRTGKVLETLVGTIDAKSLVQATLATLCENFALDIGAFYLYHPDKEYLTLYACHGFTPATENEFYRLGEGLPGACAQSGKPHLLTPVPADTKYLVNSFPGKLVPLWLLHLPVASGEKLIGVFGFAGLLPLKQEKIATLEHLAIFFGIAFENAFHYVQMRELSERLETLNEELIAQNEELNAQAEELQAQAEELQSLTQELAAQSVELEQKNLALEQATKAKSEFLAKMSHELRTPLNAIIGFTELLLTGAAGTLTPRQQEYLTDVHESSNHLLALINDILDLAKIESGKIELQIEEVDLFSPLQNALHLLTPEATKKDLTIENRVPPGEFLVMADAYRLQQVFNNLLSNAVKFTPAGGRIYVAASRKENMVAVTVADTGIGIKAEDIPKIFEEFKQVDSSISRHYGGTGLGLAIVKKIVEMHGGAIWVESTPGKGSAFTFTLPCSGASRVS